MLYEVDNSDMPLQLLQSVLSLFLQIDALIDSSAAKAVLDI
jgi:hypothetical protein